MKHLIIPAEEIVKTLQVLLEEMDNNSLLDDDIDHSDSVELENKKPA